jgi:hypothetical protein
MVLQDTSTECADAIGDAVLALRDDAATVLANTPFLLTRCSSDLRYLFVSEAYAKMIGHCPEEAVGKKIIQVMGETGFNTILPYVEVVLLGLLAASSAMLRTTEFEASAVLVDQAFFLGWVQLLPSQAGELLAVLYLPSVRGVAPGTLATLLHPLQPAPVFV